MNLFERIKKYPEETALAFIILIGAVLRFRHLGFTSLSNDELSALTRTRFTGFTELIEKGVATDGHPAFVQVMLYYWIKIFGDGVFSIRFPFSIAGIFSIPFIYLLGKKWFNKNTGLFAAAALSTLEFPLLYSQIARPYIFGMLFCLMAAYFWTLAFLEASPDRTRKKKNYFLFAYILSMSACMYTHYFSFLQAVIIGFTGLFFTTHENRKVYILSGIAIILLFIPHLFIFFKQLAIGGVGLWLAKPDENFFRLFINYCFNDSFLIYYICIGICLESFIYFRKIIQLNKFHWLALLWFLLPFFIGYYYSVWRNPVLQYSTLFFGFPFLLLFIFSFIPENAFSKKIILPCLAVFTLVTCYSTIKEKHYYWTNHFGVFKELAEDAVKWSDKYGEDKMLKVISVYNPKYINYYFDKIKRKIKIDLYKADEEADVARLMAMVDTTSATYFLYGWTNIWHPYEAEQIILNKFPIVAERDTFFNSQITLYKRGEPFAQKKVIPDATDFESNNWDNETNIRTDELSHSGKYSQKFTDQTEYSINYIRPLMDFDSIENGIVTATVWMNAKDTATDAKLVLCFEHEGKSFEWYAADLKSFNLKPGTWQQAIISRPLPKNQAGNDVLKVYVWNTQKKNFFIDDFEVKVGKRKNKSGISASKFH